MKLTARGLGIKVEALGAERYARDVMPHSHAEWGGGRELDEHIADVSAVANSRFGRQREHLIGLIDDGGEIAASLKLYARSLRWGDRMLRASGIGAVFTQPPVRGRGYATMLLASMLDRERAAGRDFAFLYSDIGTAFYEVLDFVALPSRTIAFPASALSRSKVEMSVLQTEDWPGIARCANALASRQPYSFTRPPMVWDWFRRRWAQRTAGSMQTIALVSRRRASIVAYVMGRRDPERDCLIVDDFGFAASAGPRTLSRLLCAAAGDLRRVRGWLPPAVARDALPRGTIGDRTSGVLMAVGLSEAGRDWVKTAATPGLTFDPVWNADYV